MTMSGEGSGGLGGAGVTGVGGSAGAGGGGEITSPGGGGELGLLGVMEATSSEVGTAQQILPVTPGTLLTVRVP